jgi:ornithine cyclodeaminase
MTQIFHLDEIEAAVDPGELVDAVAAGLVALSRGEAVVPPVGLLHFDTPPGDVHIKYGYVIGGATYVVKVASGFYDNPQRGLPTNDGIMMVFDRETGALAAILMDRGYLTELRTGAAGAVAARHLAPSRIDRVGIVGAGVQGRFQLRLLRHVIDVPDVVAWSRSSHRLDGYRRDMAAEGFDVATTTVLDEVVDTCNLIVTATPAARPIIRSVRSGTHVTALGSDNIGKQEIDVDVLLRADLVAADSRDQALHHGESVHAVARGLDPDSVVELGDIISGTAPGRTDDTQVTVADLTGVAVADLAAAELAVRALAT